MTDTEQQPTFKFKINDRVRLKEDRHEVYPAAFGGSEGWIKDQRVDDFGNYKMVYVVWDREHWTYNGERDLWTFEDHFDKVEEEPMAEEPGKPSKDAIAQALSVLAQGLGVESPTQGSPEQQPEPEVQPVEHEDRFHEILNRALDTVADGDAFMIVSVRAEDPPPGVGVSHVLIPSFFSAATLPEARLLLYGQLAAVVADHHQELAVREIERTIEGAEPSLEDEPAEPDES